MRSISNASAAPTAHERARSRIRSASTSRRSGSSALLSSRPRIGRSGSRITAPANTGPKRAPRPASSKPAIDRNPASRAARSKRLLGTENLFSFAKPGSLALETAQIVQLGAANAAGAHHIHVIDHGSVHREDAL